MDTANGQKVALVTGASSGIGEATALEFARRGFKVAITGRDPARLEAVREALVAASPHHDGAHFATVQADFKQPDQVDQVLDKCLAQLAVNRLDVLVNNAGFGGRSKLSEPNFYDDFKEVMQVNLFSATRLSQLASQLLIQSKGVIVNVSSIADRIAMPNISYSVSKAGLSMLTRTLANALDNTGVRVVCVNPGPVKTLILRDLPGNFDDMNGLTSLGRVGESREVADLIAFLASDKASFIHGSTIDIDGGTFTKFGGVFNQYLQESP